MPRRKPYNKTTGRDYNSDYSKFQSSDKAKKDRASRNKARRKAIREGRVKKGDRTKDVDHVDGNPRSKKTRVISSKTNRAKK